MSIILTRIRVRAEDKPSTVQAAVLAGAARDGETCLVRHGFALTHTYQTSA